MRLRCPLKNLRLIQNIEEDEMSMQRICKSLTVALLASLSAGLAHAHGNQMHSQMKALSEQDFEQMPWGIAADSSMISRTINVSMSDSMRFEPESFRFNQGDVVRFSVTNKGQSMHEFVVGTYQANKEHAELMRKFPNMEHDAPYMAHVAPGQTKEIIWKFNQAGDFQVACLIAGHFDAGMVGSVKVLRKK